MPITSWNHAIGRSLQVAFQADEAARLLVTEGVANRSGAEELTEALGEERVQAVPVSPGSLVAIGAGAALAGGRTVVELPEEASVTQAVGHLADHVASIHYASGGRVRLPLLIRAVVGHEDAAADETSAACLPHLRVVSPSSVRDAAAITRAALTSDGPVLMLEPLQMLDREEDTPETDELLEIGSAGVLIAGGDVTVLAVGAQVEIAQQAVAQLQLEGLAPELIDLRTISPLDREVIVRSVAKTGRALIADMADSVGGWGAQVAAELAEHAFHFLETPIRRRSSIGPGGQASAESLADAIRELAAE